MAPLTKIKTEPPAPTETPVTSETPTTPETQTMADVFGGMPSVETMDPTMESIYGGYKADATQSVDPRKIRSDITNQFSDRLTSLGSIYDRQLEKVTRQQEEASDAELGRARALEARGIGGFGNVVQANRRANTALQDATQSVADAKTLALDKIYGDIDTLTASETASKRAAKAAGASNFLNYIKEQKTRKDNYSNELAQSLLNDPVLATREFTDKDFDELAKRGATLGLTKGDVATAYRAAKKAADAAEAAADAQAKKDLSFSLSEGQSYYEYNPETGKYDQIASKAKTYAPSSGTGGGGTGGIYDQLDYRTANAVISQGNGFSSDPTVKTYNALVSAANLINGVDPNTQNPADHQAIVYNFAKALDPDSVVREGEYATIKKYSQGLASKYKGEINQAVNGTGFLSPAAIQAIQAATQNRVSSYTPQYQNVRAQTAARINSIAGAPVADQVLLDFEGGYTNTAGAQGGAQGSITAPDGSEIIIVD